MAENSKIEWCDHTFNPWRGCTKVSPACDNCYAEAQCGRFGIADWGPHADRQLAADSTWKQPHTWNRKAIKAGVRAKVFCASLADVFDNHKSIKPYWREALWQTIRDTPQLDWLLLTKRPQNIDEMLPADWGWDDGGWPNVWLGTTVENQTEAHRRIPHLLDVPARVRFLSCEPLLGPVDLTWVRKGEANSIDALTGRYVVDGYGQLQIGKIDWVIAGGESGPGARPSHPNWFRQLRDHCAKAGVPFHFKQWGEWLPFTIYSNGNLDPTIPADGFDLKKLRRWRDDGGFTPIAPEEPVNVAMAPGILATKVGKHRAGRLLDGVIHDGSPVPAE
jgi:protein gp37